MLSLRKSGMDTLSPDKLSLILQNRKPNQHSLRLSAGGWNAEVFPRQPPKSWKLASTNPRVPCPRPELALFCTCKQTQVHIFHRYSCQARQSPAVSSWVQRATPVLPSGTVFWRVLENYFYSRASTDLWSTNYMAIILLKSAITSRQ